MRSIIDEIAEAEAQAEKVRQEAVSASRELIQKTKAQAEQELAALDASERRASGTAISDAEQKGKALSEQVFGELSSSADELCAAAEKKTDEAVAYLLKKVQEIA